jgi:D-alanyl-D-alanine carboxypeptidase
MSPCADEEMHMLRTCRWSIIRILLVVVAALALVAPARISAPAQAARAPSFSPAIQRQLRQVVDAALGPKAPGIIVGIWAPDRGTWTYAAGLADVATKEPARPQDATRIGSVTKTFVGTLVLQLVDQGKLSLDAPVGRWLPTLPWAKQVTIRELLNMTSGIYEYGDDPGFLPQALKHVTVQGNVVSLDYRWQPQQLVALAAKHPLYFAPGAGFHYSDTNFIILGMLLEKVTGRSLADLLQAKITGPLHLAHTSLPSGASLPVPYWHGHTQLPGSPVVLDATHVAQSQSWAAGGMVSTLDDLHVWAQALATGALLSPTLQAQRLQMTPQSGHTYGMAIFDGFGGLPRGYVGHGGDSLGYCTIMLYQPATRATIVVLMNFDPVPADHGPAVALFDKLAGVLHGLGIVE